MIAETYWWKQTRKIVFFYIFLLMLPKNVHVDWKCQRKLQSNISFIHIFYIFHTSCLYLRWNHQLGYLLLLLKTVLQELKSILGVTAYGKEWGGFKNILHKYNNSVQETRVNIKYISKSNLTTKQVYHLPVYVPFFYYCS